MVNGFIAEYIEYVKIIGIGLIGGLLGLLERRRIPRDDIVGWKKVVSFLSATLSSIFVCWLAYEFALIVFGNTRAALAVGGYFAWQGAEWTRSKINKLLDNKFIGKSNDFYYRDYSYGGDYPYVEQNKTVEEELKEMNEHSGRAER